MKLLFAATFAAAGLLATAASAGQHQPGPMRGPGALPDFPAYAQPGECYARVPLGGGQPLVSDGQRVWTIERGTGPGAVWRFDQRPVTGTTGAAGLDWARVDCNTGAPLGGMAQAAPPPPPLAAAPPARPLPHPAPPPPEVYAEGPPPPPLSQPLPQPLVRPMPGPFAHGPMPHGVMPHQPPHHAMPAPVPAPPAIMVPITAPFGPFANGPSPLAPHVFAPPPMFQPAPQPYAHALPPVGPRWFGDRYLTWAGKR